MVEFGKVEPRYWGIYKDDNKIRTIGCKYITQISMTSLTNITLSIGFFIQLRIKYLPMELIILSKAIGHYFLT